MLNRIILNGEFKQCITAIKALLWPGDEYSTQLEAAITENKEKWGKFKERELLLLTNTPDYDELVKTEAWQDLKKEQEQFLNQIVQSVIAQAPKGSYRNMEKNQDLPLPFLENYREYFLKRAWSTPNDQLEDLSLQLKPVVKTGKIMNPSANYRNYFHFINVIATTAHLINFFSTKNANDIEGILISNNSYIAFEHLKPVLFDEFIKEDVRPCKRTFTLMLAAFYHDLGKTVVDHRHALEGSIIISSYKSRTLMEFDQIARSYDYPMDREDLLFISDLVYFHDIYGTLSTGENGYTRLVNMIDKIDQYSRDDSQHNSSNPRAVKLNYNRLKAGGFLAGRRPAKEPGGKPEAAIKLTLSAEGPRSTAVEGLNPVVETITEREGRITNIGKQQLFDLWLLNVADIIVSLDNKFEEKDFCKLQFEEMKPEIIKFFNGNRFHLNQGNDLIHDLKIAFDLYQAYRDSEYLDNYSKLKDTSYNCSYHHRTSRIRRIIKNSLFCSIHEKIKNIGAGTIYHEILEIKDYTIDQIIEKTIKSSSDYLEFNKEFSWIGQMDYSIGFFKDVTDFLLNLIREERATGSGVRETKWINNQYNETLYKDNPDMLNQINARYIVDNYVAIVIQIFRYLLNTRKIDGGVINYEFEDARKRLTPEKIERILALEGPARSLQSTMLILDTVFVY